MTRTCSNCGGYVSRMSRTGVCWSCYTLKNHRPATVSAVAVDAEQGSRRLLEGYARYYRNHVAGRPA